METRRHYRRIFREKTTFHGNTNLETVTFHTVFYSSAFQEQFSFNAFKMLTEKQERSYLDCHSTLLYLVSMVIENLTILLLSAGAPNTINLTIFLHSWTTLFTNSSWILSSTNRRPAAMQFSPLLKKTLLMACDEEKNRQLTYKAEPSVIEHPCLTGIYSYFKTTIVRILTILTTRSVMFPQTRLEGKITLVSKLHH